MSRRVFLKSITALLGGFSLPAMTHAEPGRMKWKTLQISPVAGFEYYQGERLWPQLDIGQFLTLTRESHNPYDKRTVRIDWQGNHRLSSPDGQRRRLATAGSRRKHIGFDSRVEKKQ